MKKVLYFIPVVLSVLLFLPLALCAKPSLAAEPQTVVETAEGLEAQKEDGTTDTAFTGFFRKDGKKYYFKEGICDTSYTGIVKHSKKKWYYLKDGAQDKTYRSIARENGKGSWYYVENGKVNKAYTGTAEYKNRILYIENGKWKKKAEGMYALADGVYYFKKGEKDTSYDGWLNSGSNTYYLEEGKGVTGWKTFGGDRYYFKKSGKMAKKTAKIKGRLEVFHMNGTWIDTASMDKKAKKLKSKTQYLILVDIDKCVTKIYQGKKGDWKCVKNILCTVGDPTKGWDTVKGTFYVGYSSWGNPITRGPSFVDAENHTLYYWTRFCDSFLFHSRLYKLGTKTLEKKSNALGAQLSHGCVRMDLGKAKWIYRNIPDGTKVVVY